MATSDSFKRETFTHYDIDINCPCCSEYRKMKGTRKNTKPLLRRLVRRSLRLQVKEEMEDRLMEEEAITKDEK